ncbi:MAG: penicillin acylase family protein, partial [Candidatus Lindowbacteria bacterium]|nr:penicillin acylase family protein [Candidatus Lindowbacteria bacterium]
FGRAFANHTRWGESGQTSTQVVVLSNPIKSWAYLPIGESDRPESPHYRDQAEKLFSPRKLKPTWYAPEELAEHIESRIILDRAPGGR